VSCARSQSLVMCADALAHLSGPRLSRIILTCAGRLHNIATPQPMSKLKSTPAADQLLHHGGHRIVVGLSSGSDAMFASTPSSSLAPLFESSTPNPPGQIPPRSSNQSDLLWLLTSLSPLAWILPRVQLQASSTFRFQLLTFRLVLLSLFSEYPSFSCGWC